MRPQRAEERMRDQRSEGQVVRMDPPVKNDVREHVDLEPRLPEPYEKIAILGSLEGRIKAPDRTKDFRSHNSGDEIHVAEDFLSSRPRLRLGSLEEEVLPAEHAVGVRMRKEVLHLDLDLLGWRDVVRVKEPHVLS